MVGKPGRKPNNKTHKVKALSEYLFGKCHGEFAKSIQTSKAHLSLILSGKKQASLKLVNRIAFETEFEVTMKDLRPDIYNKIMEYNAMERRRYE